MMLNSLNFPLAVRPVILSVPYGIENVGPHIMYCASLLGAGCGGRMEAVRDSQYLPTDLETNCDFPYLRCS